MNDTTYIGMRYVPKFAEPSQWDITRQYENLIMVTDNGETYISKKAVPTGIELSNEDYWNKLSVPSGNTGGGGDTTTGGGYQYSDLSPVDTGNKWIHGETIWAWKFNNMIDNFTSDSDVLQIDLPSQLTDATILKATIVIDGSRSVFPTGVVKLFPLMSGPMLSFLISGIGNTLTFALDDYIVFEFVVEEVNP